MPINQSFDKDYLLQQTFMGASIVNFNANLGFNSNSTTLSINLIEDKQNKRKPNAVDEGYHIWDKEKGWPAGATANYKSTGDLFYAPVAGEPAYFTYYKSSIKQCGECRADKECTEGGKNIEGATGLDTKGECEYHGYSWTQRKKLPNKDGKLTIQDYRVRNDITSEDECKASGMTWKTPKEVTNKRKLEEEGQLESIYEFNGIVKNYKRDVGSNGVRYTVTLEDARPLLEGTQVILDGYESTTPPADASYNIITGFRNKKYKNRRYYKYGAIGYYNILNPFGFYEFFQFGSADVNQNGMPWVKILDALATILKGKYDIWEDDEGDEYDLERFGGPLYYVKDSRDDQLMKATEPVNVHRYQVDIKDMYNLHTSQGGPLGDDVRIKAESMSLLSLIQKICEIAGADFFTDLVVKKEDGIEPIAKKTKDKLSEYSGIIKITPIPRNATIIPGLIQKEIDTATEQSKLSVEGGGDCESGDPKHPWARRIVNHNIGYEFKDPVSGVMLVGAPRTRVVGVSSQGWFPAIKGGMIRKRFAVGGDKLKEFMPSIEQDGVTYANPGWYYPYHLPDNERKLSVDQVDPITKAMWNVSNPLTPTSNDDAIAWQHSLTSGMQGKLNMLDDVRAVEFNTGKPPFQYNILSGDPGIVRGEGLIDLYPVWGFMRGIDQFKGVFQTSKMLSPKSNGIPIKGRFNDDDAYRDFDITKGIFSIFEYYDYDHGHTYATEGGDAGKMGPCFFTPYAANCPAYDIPKGSSNAACWKSDNANALLLVDKKKNPVARNKVDCNKAGGKWYSKDSGYVTYRYKLASKAYDKRKSVYVPAACCDKGGKTGSTGTFDSNCQQKRNGIIKKGNTLCGNPNYNLLQNFTFVTPKTATIPIDLWGLGWSGGGQSLSGDFSHYYYATVTELRAASGGFQSWMEYTQIFAPWLHCGLGLPTCPMAVSNQGGIAVGRNMAGGWERKVPEEVAAGAGKPDKQKADHAAYPVVHSFNRWLGIVPPMLGDEDGDGRVDKIKDISLSDVPGVALANKRVDEILQKVFERVSATANQFYGQKYLMALPFTPPDASQHIRRISEVAFEYEQKWDLASDGWVDVNFTTPEVGKRYPHNINFYSNEGNLESFVVHPWFEKQRMNKSLSRIWIDGEAQEEGASKELHHTPLADSLGGGSAGKTFVKASTDQTTYWLWSTSTYDIQTGKANAGTIKPYALISANSKAFYEWDDPVFTGRTPQGEVKEYDPVGRVWKDGLFASSVFSVGSIPLREFNGRYLFNSNFLYTTATNIYHHGSVHSSAMEDRGKITIGKAWHKPWAAAAPQRSNRYKWGPWALGTGFGKAKYEVSSTYHPAAFGSFDNMEIAGIEKCKASVEPDQVTSGWAVERGSITLAGLPSPKDANHPRRQIMGKQLRGQGPYITDVSIDISPGGVTTTYNMQTQRKFGKLQEIYETRMLQQSSNLVETMKDLADSM